MRPLLAAAMFGGIAWYTIETMSVTYTVISIAAGLGFFWGWSEEDTKRINARINAIWDHLDPL